ncbi:hypothetical protein Trydic_g5499 [Trypoxylus dichotomus]
MGPKDKDKPAFTIGTHLQFTVLPFGPCNVLTTFERLKDYSNDIILLGKTFDDHLRNLEQIFRRLRGPNLKLHPKKCNLFQKQVQYLDHLVSGKRISVDQEKIEAVKNWPVPKDTQKAHKKQ